MYQYSSMAPKLSGQNCKFFKFPLFLNSQKRLRYKENNTKYRSLTWKPRGHVRILIYRTWPIDLITRLWGITTEFVGFIPHSPLLTSIVLGWILIYLNLSIDKEPMNPRPEWIYRFLWYNMIWVIKTQITPKRNAPKHPAVPLTELGLLILFRIIP